MKMSGSSKKNIRNLIIAPLICFVAVCAALLVVLAPTIKDAVSIGTMFISDKQMDYSGDYENIFVPTDKKGDTVNAEDVEFPTINKQFGELAVESCDVQAKLFFGDGKIPLKNGVGIYAGSFVPGYGKTILVAGHNNTYFNGLKNIKKGDVVSVRTSWGNYKYKVKETKVLDAQDKKAIDLNADKETLVMYTCYPFDEIGLTSKRFFVYADKISGPEIVGLYG